MIYQKQPIRIAANFILLVLLAATFLPLSAQTIRRATTDGDAAADGSTWENAMTLKAALAASTTADDQVWIAAGTYKPASRSRTATFTIPAGISVYGGFAGTETTFDPTNNDTRQRETDSTFTNETILSGDLLGDDIARTATGYAATRDDNSNTVVTIGGADVTLDGLTLTAGEGGTFNFGAGLRSVGGGNITVTNCTFTNNTAKEGGGASFFQTATLTNCTFTGNTASTHGGGAYFFTAGTLADCAFTGNRAPNGGGVYFSVSGGRLTGCAFTDNTTTGNGGGVYFKGTATLTRCMFMGNTATSNGGGTYFDNTATMTDCSFTSNRGRYGGGTFFNNTATMTDCSFTSNTATSDGGGARFNRTGTLTNCMFSSNVATTGNGGGARFNAGGTLTNCMFSSNVATTGNGGGAHFSSAATLTNGVFANNKATNGGGMYLTDGGTITNSTLYSDTATARGGGIYVRYSGGGDFNLRNSLLISNTATADSVSGPQVYVNNTNATNDRVNLQHNLLAGGADPAGTNQGVVYFTPEATNIAQANTVTEADTAVVFASTTAGEDNYLRLNINSPAANAGNNDYVDNAITTDRAGAVRIQGGTVDLGAYESDIKGTQTIDFTLNSPGMVGTELALAATASSGLSVSYASSNPTAAVVDSMEGSFILRLIAEDTVIITASQSGNDTYEAATDVTQTIVVRVPVIRRVTTAGDTGRDGSTWATAMTLKAALAASDPLDQVWIASGTYQPDSIDQAATFTIPEGVLVYGGFVGDEADNFDPMTTARTGAATILSGDLLGDDTIRTATGYAATRDDNSNTVVTIAGENVTLNGLTIQGGEGGTYTDVGEGAFRDFGAGLYSDFANTTVVSCTFRANNAPNTGTSEIGIGGGAYFGGTTTLTSCTFTDNTAGADGGAIGIFFGSFTITLTDCTFTGNRAGRGGGALNFGNTSILTNCTFTGNTSGADGGAAIFSNSATLTDCAFTGNTSGISGGAAIFSNSATLTNCVVADNRANTNGGGVWFGGGATVINSTFYNNTAGAQNENGGGIYIANHADSVTLQNNLLIGNSAVEGDQVYVENTDAARVITLQHNLIAGGDTGIVYTNSGASGIMETNTVTEADSSVVFASTTADEDNYLHLKEGSPAVNVGNNDYVNNVSPAITTDLAELPASDAAG